MRKCPPRAATAGEKLALSLTGSFAETHLTLEADGTGSLDDLKASPGTLKLHADGEDSAEVLAAARPRRRCRCARPAEARRELRGQARFGRQADGRRAPSPASISTMPPRRRSRDGRARAWRRVQGGRAPTSIPLLLLGGIAVPGIGEGHAASASGRLELFRRRPRACRSRGVVRRPAGQRRPAGDARAEHRALRRARSRDRVAAVPRLARRRRGARLGRRGLDRHALRRRRCRRTSRSTSRSTPRRSISARRMPATDAKLDFSLSGGALQPRPDRSRLSPAAV